MVVSFKMIIVLKHRMYRRREEYVTIDPVLKG